MTMTLECQKWKQMFAWSTMSFSRPMVVTGTTIALVLWNNFPLHKNFPSYKKIVNKILLNFRKRALPKFFTWLHLWHVCCGNDFFTTGIQHSACFTNFLYHIFQASAKGKAFPCQVFWKINKSPAIILSASTDKFNKWQDAKPRFPNGIAFFFVFDNYYRVAPLRHGQVLQT